jgi:hypothetical protein
MTSREIRAAIAKRRDAKAVKAWERRVRAMPQVERIRFMACQEMPLVDWLQPDGTR